MRLLLDTHVAIWAVTGSGKLSDLGVTMIADPAHDIYFSIATLWEMAIKNASGRSNLGLASSQAAKEFAVADFRELPIALRHVVEVEQMPRLHGDPFDRLLVATAKAEGLHLLTHDRTLAAYGDHVLLV